MGAKAEHKGRCMKITKGAKAGHEGPKTSLIIMILTYKWYIWNHKNKFGHFRFKNCNLTEKPLLTKLRGAIIPKLIKLFYLKEKGMCTALLDHEGHGHQGHCV